MTLSSFSDDLYDAVSDFSSAAIGGLTSVEVLVLNFLGNVMGNFLPKSPFFFSSVGDVGTDGCASAPGVSGNL